ncbi:hypothetical protein [Streptomyces niveus]|uniref:hypothetical protein n=1 Tax=Streptomyces niveus TaxID=193462 RepID=UPI0034144204
MDLDCLYDPKLQILQPVDASPWVGRSVHGPHRHPGRVEKVFTTPFGVEVALLSQNLGTYKGLRLEVTELLSAAGIQAARRTEFLRNESRLMALHPGEGSSRRTSEAWHRRCKAFEHYTFAKWYIKQALIAQVKAGDELVYGNGPRVVVLDPDAGICRFTGLRTHVRVKAQPEYEAVLRGWGWADDTHDVFVDRGEPFPLPTLGLI